MNKKQVTFWVYILLLINTAGCWDAQDIENMSFPIAASYDLHESTKKEIDKTHFYVDISTLSPNLSPQSDSKISVEKQSAPTAAFARYQRPMESGQVYQPAMVQVIIIGEDLARLGINPYLDALLRAPIISSTLNLAVCCGRGEDILLTKVDDFTNTGVLLQSLLRKASKKSFIPDTTLHQFAAAQIPGKNPVLPLIESVGDNKIRIKGSALFKKDQYITSLDVLESRTLVLLRGITSNGNLPFFLNPGELNHNSGTIRVRNKRKVIVSRQGDAFSFLIKIELNGSVEDYTSYAQKIDERKLQEIENKVASDITGECRQFIKKMQEEWEFDCIDISKYALAKWRKELTPVIDKDFIQNVYIDVEVEVHLENAGELT